MNIQIRYFTKSGNTEKIAKAIGEEIGIPAEKIGCGMSERADVLFLGCSYYAFDMDENVKKFLHENKDKIGKLVLFGTSAMMKSMKKPMAKVLSDMNIEVLEEEFHCRGSFGVMHKGRPNDEDIKAAKEFAAKVVKSL